MPRWGYTKMHAYKKQLPICSVCQESTTVSLNQSSLKNNVRNIPATVADLSRLHAASENSQ